MFVPSVRHIVRHVFRLIFGNLPDWLLFWNVNIFRLFNAISSFPFSEWCNQNGINNLWNSWNEVFIQPTFFGAKNWQSKNATSCIISLLKKEHFFMRSILCVNFVLQHILATDSLFVRFFFLPRFYTCAIPHILDSFLLLAWLLKLKPHCHNTANNYRWQKKKRMNEWKC